METDKKKVHLPGFLHLRRKARAAPATVVEVASRFVLGTRVTGPGKSVVRSAASVEFDAGVVEPSPRQLNVVNPGELTQKLQLLRLHIHEGSCSLLIPDGAARVSVLSLEALPAKSSEVDALIRWRVKESLGFPAEQARLAYQAVPGDGGFDLLVVAVHEAVLAQYEAMLEAIKAEAELILPVTLALLPLLPENDGGAQFLSHISSGWVTHAIVTGNRLRFWRCRRLDNSSGDEAIAGVVAEAARARASAEDRLGVEIERAWYCARPALENALPQELERVLGCPVTPILPALAGKVSPRERLLLDSFGAPVAGLLINSGALQ